ncbi:hypothetical protein [Mycobacteroides abscessus]|uniref:Transmembrane protein n=1 Tax=Mycobacteroides abscessus subsp. abscessus TaxID=1185650 RepID=A0AB38CZB2_9MYCO|nr:hypothetical protein [Mycobacteroides abscessus]SHO86396.1 Uncharacterised protein [Mycobacteroides abscessus subsp. abscessus]SHP07664.1 Uncharacterised protein [Mycobacteroides abscessus subsp. abscessus]SHP38604.1 Uncharacterised protein [Mycobacteroides abscessus subsp. abscessus]SHP46739.1 Uncharacterised protein [Mycobacteroides abscessus subsp. abscessus]SHP47238.1 Uncharacterised protein [Mycobacteroides abscessus subsp. abscessus]
MNETEMWKVMHRREDELADRWYKPAGIGLLAGIIGTAIAVSNHPTPTWALVVSVIGWVVCVGSFAIAMGTGYRDGSRLESYVNSLPDDDGDVEDYPEDFDDDDFPDDDEPTPSTPAKPAPPAVGNLLSSLRQQGGVH